MDPLGLLQAVGAIAVYPGCVFLGLLATALRWTSGAAAPLRMTAAGAAGCLAAVVATALAPLPGSLLSTLPPPPGFGPPANLLGVLVLEAMAIALVRIEPWRRRDVIAAAAAALPALALASAAATLSLPVLAGLPGSLPAAGRILAGGALLAGAPALLRPERRSPAALVALTGLAVQGLALAGGPWLASLPAPAAAAAVALAVALYGAILRVVQRGRAASTALVALASVQGAAALAVILVARA